MSKTGLKKELKTLSEEQVKEMVLDLYTSCKEARQYLDFFVDPDVDELFEKHFKEIEKEAWRGKYGRSTARISRIKGTVRHFMSFNAGADHDLALMEKTIVEMLRVAYRRYVSGPFEAGIVRLAVDMLKYGEQQQMFDRALAAYDRILSSDCQTRSMKRELTRELEDFLALARPLHK